MIHLQKFIDRVQGTEARGLKDVSIPLSDAKAMSAELTRILLEMQTLRERAVQTAQNEVVTVSMDGGTFK
jgi:hypothetical protein